MSELEQCYRALEIIGKSFVQKSATSYQSPRVARSCLIAKATRTPAGAILAKKILRLQKQEAMRAQYGPIIKSMGLDWEETQEDEWSSLFSKADSEEDLLKRLKELQDEKNDIISRIRSLRGLED
jgi:hypothetical protein